MSLQRRCPPQAAAWLAALGGALTEVDGGAATARRLGALMAEAMQGPADDTLEALEIALNDNLAVIDFGMVRLRTGDDSLTIEVFEYPAVNDSPEAAEIVVFGVLEGLLTAYLNGLSGADELAARLLVPPASTAESVCFEYARHQEA